VTLHYEFEVGAPVERVWALLSNLERLLSLLPDVRIAGIAAGEVFGTIRTNAGGPDFRGVARLVQCDEATKKLIFEVRSLTMPQPEQPAVLATVRLEPVGDRTGVAVVAEVGSATGALDIDAIESRWSRTMPQFASKVTAQLAVGTRTAMERPAATQMQDGLTGVAARYAASGVVRLFYAALGLATRRRHIPRGPVRLYGEPSKKSDS
jgi:carbon monoxide dehydrogenase subunit G